jgi:hypothetical protein
MTTCFTAGPSVDVIAAAADIPTSACCVFKQSRSAKRGVCRWGDGWPSE